MYQCGRRIDRESKAILGSFQVISVVASSIPLNNASLLISEWNVTKQKPAILAVNTPYAGLGLERLSRNQTRTPLPHDSSGILSMKSSAPPPALDLFQFESRKFQPPPIDEIERAVRLSAHDQTGDGVDYKPKPVLDRSRPCDTFTLVKRLHNDPPKQLYLSG
jgi:hypothetical protein